MQCVAWCLGLYRTPDGCQQLQLHRWPCFVSEFPRRLPWGCQDRTRTVTRSAWTRATLPPPAMWPGAGQAPRSAGVGHQDQNSCPTLLVLFKKPRSRTSGIFSKIHNTRRQLGVAASFISFLKEQQTDSRNICRKPQHRSGVVLSARWGCRPMNS